MTRRNLEIDIAIPHPSLRLNEEVLNGIIGDVLTSQASPDTHITVVLAGHELVGRMNRDYLNHDFHTDVLAFDYGIDDSGIRTAEVYVDLDSALERCEEYDTAFDEEALRYVVHGLLHLIGYTDGSPEGKARMHQRENYFLDRMVARRANDENRT